MTIELFLVGAAPDIENLTSALDPGDNVVTFVSFERPAFLIDSLAASVDGSGTYLARNSYIAVIDDDRLAFPFLADDSKLQGTASESLQLPDRR